MGVQGLWELLAPVGRRVSVETLAGKKLAIDASIWMIQFMKAMRDDKGEMVRNAHLLGFFRRICKLLFLRTKPVFVFDGGTPALKRRTVIARRRQRENAHAKIRKTAEKLLLNHLKAIKLKELADDIKSQRTKNVDKGKKVVNEQIEKAGDDAEGNDTAQSICNQEALDELLAASLAAEEDETFIGNASTSGVGIPTEEEDDDEDEEMILPAMNGKVDPAVLAALPPSMQLDLLVQMRERLMAENRQKYQKVKKAPAKFSELQIESYLKTVAFRREIDEVQKSAAGKGVGGVQTSRIASEANREFIFSSSFTGNKEVLTSVGVESHGETLHQTPSESPSLDSLSGTAPKKKENAETRPVADDPGVGFNSDVMTYMDERGRVRVSKVRAMGIRMTRDLQRNLDLMKEIEQGRMSTSETPNNEFIFDKNACGVSRKFPDKIRLRETSDKDALVHLDCRNDESTINNLNSMEISFEDDGASKCLDDDDDQLFASLVAGDPAMVSSADDSPSKKHPCGSDSSVDWEEGITGYNAEKDDGLAPANEKESRLPLAEGGSNDDDEVEWEDGDSVVFKDTNSVPAETSKTSLKGDWKEEADLQEAIKRSLEDFRGQRSNDASFADNKLNNAREVDCETASIGSFLHGNSKVKPYVPYGDVLQAEKFSNNITSEVEKMDSEDKMDTVNTDDCPTGQLAQSIEFNFDSREEAINKPQERNPNSCDGLFRHDTNEVGNLLGDIGCKKTGMHLVMEQALGMHNTACQVSTHADSSSIVSSKISNIVSSEIFDSSSNTTPDVVLSDAQQNVTEVAQATGVAEPGDSSVKESTTLRTVLEAAKGKMEPGQSSFRELTSEQEVVKKDRTYDHIVHSGGDEVEGIALKDGKDHPVEVTEASLEEEMLNLTKECTDLGVEQRRLERNAESVSSEMFAECQELLQMFGLPYIIAPMEAEAQCAYMELAKLVDGVVTDDSDAFLFGARSVYKNIFDDRKYVETYFMKDIENELGLTREKLIHMALLLGSDYTEGVSGIGIVNAIEVVNAFSEEDGLRKFREWIESPDPTILGTLDVHIGSRRRGSKGGSGSNKEDLSAPGQTDAPSMHCIDEKKQIFMDKHRNVSKNWHIPSSFPSEAVISAYAAPQVDNSTEPFSWGKPDRLVLRKLCWEKFGWSAQKADELLLPVLKEYNKHETQLRLEAFYTFNERFAKIRSKRIKKAVRGITGNASSELIDEFGQEASKGRKKRRIGASERGEDKLEKSASEMEDCDVIDGGKSTQRSIAMQSRNEKHVETRPAEGEDPKQVTNQGSIVRGDQPGGRGGRKRHHGLGVENSNEDGDSSDYEEEIQFEKLGGCQRGVRKSTRTRKAVKYTFDDSEASEPSNPAEDGDNCNHEEAVQKEASKDCGWFGNAAGNVGDKNQDQVGGLSFETCSAMDEAEPDLETGQLNLHRNVDLSSEAESTKEYLMTGGGFCLNEDGINDTDKCASETDEASVPDDANAPSSDVITEADPETGSVQHIYSPVRDLDGFKDSSKTDVLDSRQNLDWSTSVTSDDPSGSAISPGTGVKTGDSGAAAVNSLSAMSNLRRKKRRKH